jgi:hypothetical protein
MALPVSGSGTSMTQAQKDHLVRAAQNFKLCKWWDEAGVVDRLAYLADHEPPIPWSRGSGTTSPFKINYTGDGGS